MGGFFRIMFVCLVLLPVLSACSVEPNIMHDRIFTDPDIPDSENPWELLPADGDSKERVCIAVEDAVAARGSGPSWLLQKLPDNTGAATGPEVGPITYVIERISQQLERGKRAVFEAVALNPTFKDILIAFFTLGIMFFGLGILTNRIQNPGMDAIILIVKMSFIGAVVLDYELFQDIVEGFFEGLIDGIIGAIASLYNGSAPDETSEIFDPANGMFAKFMSVEFMVILMAMMFTNTAGFFYGLVLSVTVVFFTIAVFRAMFIYMVALIARTLLYALAPFFIAMLLFKQTKSLFEAWLNQLVNFSLQPILLYSFLGIFFVLVSAFINVLDAPIDGATHICYMEREITSGQDRVSFYTWQFADEEGRLAQGGLLPEVPLNLVTLFTLLLVSYLMVMFGRWAVEAAGDLSTAIFSLSSTQIQAWNAIRDRTLAGTSTAAGGIGDLFGTGRNRFGDDGSAVEQAQRLAEDQIKQSDRGAIKE